MKVCCTSDLHGFLPEIPNCDLLLIGGDLCGPSHIGLQAAYLENQFRRWVEKLVERGIIVVTVAGNHDFIFEQEAPLARVILQDYPKEFYYLEDEGMRLYHPSLGRDSFGDFHSYGPFIKFLLK